MFRYFASQLPGTPQAKANTVLSTDAGTLAYMLDVAWTSRVRGRLTTVPSPVPAPVGIAAATAPLVNVANVPWQHLIYAYMIENTRAIEIFRRVVWEFAHGERLGIPLNDVTYAWLRTTEELFFRDGSPPPITINSRIRPEFEASRRNAYFRMFGMDLNHGPQGGAYPYEKPAVANRDFVGVFEEFLRSVWRAIVNVTNSSGPRETDPEAIANLALRLQYMLTARRGGAALLGRNLTREEFIAVTTLDWFHLTVEADTAVVVDLQSASTSPEERLRLIGERVGIPAHARSHNFFLLAQAVSALLSEIELGSYSTSNAAQSLYALPVLPATTNPIRDNVLIVINHWSMVTGRDMKAGGVFVSPRTDAPRLMPPSPMPASSAVPAGNGRTPAGTAGPR
jgi:hypothetical protein